MYVVPWLSNASTAVPRPSKIAGYGRKFKILQSATVVKMKRLHSPENWFLLGEPRFTKISMSIQV